MHSYVYWCVCLYLYVHMQWHDSMIAWYCEINRIPHHYLILANMYLYYVRFITSYHIIFTPISSCHHFISTHTICKHFLDDRSLLWECLKCRYNLAWESWVYSAHDIKTWLEAEWWISTSSRVKVVSCQVSTPNGWKFSRETSHLFSHGWFNLLGSYWETRSFLGSTLPETNSKFALEYRQRYIPRRKWIFLIFRGENCRSKCREGKGIFKGHQWPGCCRKTWSKNPSSFYYVFPPFPPKKHTEVVIRFNLPGKYSLSLYIYIYICSYILYTLQKVEKYIYKYPFFSGI